MKNNELNSFKSVITTDKNDFDYKSSVILGNSKFLKRLNNLFYRKYAFVKGYEKSQNSLLLKKVKE